MNWGRVIQIFFSLMSLTTIAGYLYLNSQISLFFAASINLIATLLRIGVRNILSAELFASSRVADLHLLPAFVINVVTPINLNMVYALVIGACVASVFSLILILIEATKEKDEF